MEAIAIVYDDGLHFVASWGRVAVRFKARPHWLVKKA